LCFTDGNPRRENFGGTTGSKAPSLTWFGGVFAILQQMATFRPPTDPLVYFDDGSGGGIFSYLSGWPRGRNVYKMTDGSFQENQPGDDSLVAKIYHGGHIHELTAAEEADLIAAGYGAYIE
jgi:hypothetical protein